MSIAILFFSKYFPYIPLRRSAFWKIKLTFIDVIFFDNPFHHEALCHKYFKQLSILTLVLNLL